MTKVVQVQVQAPAATNGYGYVEWHPSEPVEIEFWGHNFNNSAREGAQDRRTTDAFEKMYPEIKVKRVNNDWGGTVWPLEKVAAAFSAGSGMPDIFIMHGLPDVCAMNGWSMGVTEDMMPAADRQRLGYKELRFLTLQGDTRMIDLGAIIDGYLLFYRRDILEAAGVKPEDLGDYVEDAIPVFKELTKVDSTGAIVQAGIKLTETSWPAMAIQAGSDFFNKETKKFDWANSDPIIYAAQLWRDLHNVHKVTSLETPAPHTGLPDGLCAMGQNGSWTGRWLKVNSPDADVRIRKTLKFKPATKKGTTGMLYSIGLGINPQIKDQNKMKAAIEYWKYAYYNTANQADLGFENFGALTLNSAPDYKAMDADVPPTGKITPGQMTAEGLYTLSEDYSNMAERIDIGQLWNEDYLEPIWTAMLQEIVKTNGDLKTIIAKYQDQMQANWDENHWYVPGVTL